MSPHGSKFLEFARYIANNFLSDNQRKKIKALLTFAKELPQKVLGLQGTMDAQRAELDRLKSRVINLDGKLNLALWGMPVIDEYKPYLLSNLLSRQLEERFNSAEYQALLKQINELIFKGFELNSSHINLDQIKSVFIVGSPSNENLSQLINKMPQLNNISICEMNPLLIQALKTHPKKSIIESIQSDPITALTAQFGNRFDLILCFNRWQQLSPKDQIHFLLSAEEHLAQSGSLCITLPKINDLYWADYRNLRPYSTNLLNTILTSFDGQTYQNESQHNLEFIFVKRP